MFQNFPFHNNKFLRVGRFVVKNGKNMSAYALDNHMFFASDLDFFAKWGQVWTRTERSFDKFR